MNEEIQKKLVTYLNGIENMASDAVLMGKQEIPLYIQELIKWEIVYNLLRFGLNAAIIFLITYLSIKGIRWMRERDEWEPSPLLMFPIIIIVTCTFFAADAVRDASKAYFAPRVFLVEKISSLVKR